LVRKIAVFRTLEGQAEAFVEAYGGVANVLNDAEGSRGASLHRGVEGPNSFTPIVEWSSGQPEVRHVEAVA
jgi:heme-degrading monooxygenase HmoA